MSVRRSQTAVAGAMALVLLAACGPKPPVAGTPATPTPKPPARSGEPSAAPTDGPVTTSPTATPTAVATLTPVVPGTQAVLAGRVLAPRALVTAAGGIISDAGSGLLSDNGASIVSNNGGSIIANNGAGYKLRATDDVPLIGVPVTLVDGAGAAIVGPDGKPVVAMTDADGRYAFSGVRPSRHLVVKAELPKVGALSRIVAPDVADAPLDVASTLASAYILEKYVAGQADRQATLNRLPAAVEAETVLVAGQAAASEAAPLSLVRSELVTRVDALRAKAPTLDAQLEKVKQLLIVAGVSNLGDGLPGTEVALGVVRSLAIDAQGRVYVNDFGNKTLWRLDADGKLRALAGRPVTDARMATLGEAALDKDGWPQDMHLDAQGRLVLASGLNVVRRLAPDGTIERLEAGNLLVHAATSLPDGSVLGFGKDLAPGGDPWEVWKLATGQAPVKLPGIKQPFPFELWRVAAEPDGKVLVFQNSMDRRVYRYDPATGGFPKILGWNGDSVDGLALDPTGRLFYVDGDGKTRERKGDGAADPLAPGQAPLQNVISDTVVAAAGDMLYAAYSDPYRQTRSLLRRYQGAASQVVAGREEGPDATPGAGPVALVRPTGFTVEADGSLIVADDGAIVRRKPGAGAETILAAGKLLAKDGATATGLEPTHVRPAAGGGWWVVAHPPAMMFATPAHLNHVAADGTVSWLYQAIGGIADLLPLPDGGAWVAEYNNNVVETPTIRVSQLAPDRTRTIRFDGEAESYGGIQIGRAADGALVVGRQKLNGAFLGVDRVAADGTKTALPADTRLPRLVDGAGRLYWAEKAGEVVAVKRFNPAGGTTEVVAGPGGKHFAGSGVDDGIRGATHLQFGATGDLYWLDGPNRQIKRIPAADL